jgi:hypothetical protein
MRKTRVIFKDFSGHPVFYGGVFQNKLRLMIFSAGLSTASVPLYPFCMFRRQKLVSPLIIATSVAFSQWFSCGFYQKPAWV